MRGEEELYLIYLFLLDWIGKFSLIVISEEGFRTFWMQTTSTNQRRRKKEVGLVLERCTDVGFFLTARFLLFISMISTQADSDFTTFFLIVTRHRRRVCNYQHHF